MAAVCDSASLRDLLQAHDPAALDALTRCFGQRLVAVGRQRCGKEEDAQDAVQDALLAAGTHLDQFRGDGSVEGWLVTMVQRACSRLRRGQKNDPARHISDVELTAPGPSPEQQAAHQELGRTLQAALDALSAEDRVLVMLAEGHGWTAPELAEATGRTPNAVRSRLSRARRRLRATLSESAAFQDDR